MTTGINPEKEFGSDFHLCIDEQYVHPRIGNVFSDDKSFALFFSGRTAVYSLLKFGIEHYQWEKVYFPDYYCHEVVHFVRRLPVEIIYYQFNPFLDSEIEKIPFADHDKSVIVNVLFFGVRRLNLDHIENAVVVEDITHNILSFSVSKADYCFGSLRKQLPVPCGGFCYSPSGKTLPEPIHSLNSQEVALQKLSAMFLKREYLMDRFAAKPVFRKLFMEAEARFADEFNSQSEMPDIVRSVLETLNIGNIINAKNGNLKLALSLIEKSECILFKDGITFGLFIGLHTYGERESLRTYLLERNIYPAILWPNQFTERNKESESKNLFIHVDYRYNSTDINYISSVINEYTIDEAVFGNRKK
jgi:hypothetical protein